MSVDNWGVARVLVFTVVLPLAYTAFFSAILAYLLYFAIRELAT